MLHVSMHRQLVVWIEPLPPNVCLCTLVRCRASDGHQTNEVQHPMWNREVPEPIFCHRTSPMCPMPCVRWPSDKWGKASDVEQRGSRTDFLPSGKPAASDVVWSVNASMNSAHVLSDACCCVHVWARVSHRTRSICLMPTQSASNAPQWSPLAQTFNPFANVPTPKCSTT